MPQLPVSIRPFVAAAAIGALLSPNTGCLILGSGLDDGSDGDLAAEDHGDPQAPDYEDPSMPPEEEERVTMELGQCTDGLSRSLVDDTVEITFDFESSAHEMVVCGGLVANIVFSLVGGFIDLAQDPESSTLPEQYQYDGEGTYFVDVDTFTDLTMEVRFYLAKDFSFGSEGDLVTHNLFDLSTYLVDPKAEVSAEIDGWEVELDIEITHDGAGPLVELLGYGDDPPNPIHLDENDLAFIQEQLSGLELEATIQFADHPGVSTIRYDVESPRMLASSVLSGAPLQLGMLSADGWRDGLGQTLTVDTWTVEYVDGAVGALDGDIGFTVEGDRFDFEATMSYERSNTPEIAIRCAQ